MREPPRAGRTIVWTALTFFGLFTVLGILFVAAEAFTDPGGWEAAGLVTLWLAPTTGLAVVAWMRADRSIPVLGALVALVVGVAVWFAFTPEPWRSFEDAHGPIRGLLSFAAAVPIAVLGRRHPLASGLMLATVGLVPPALTAPSEGFRFAAGSMGAISGPILVTAALLLVAAWVGRSRHGRPGDEEDVEEPEPVTVAQLPWR